MGRMLGVGALAAGALVLAGSGARAVEQAEVNRAIERGVSALKKLQGADGTWPHSSYKTGATALAGLALLECDVPADDKAVGKAAAVVRQASATETSTYAIALSILFLDRLDDPADTPLIESLTVRLMAGQGASGGWTYTCP